MSRMTGQAKPGIELCVPFSTGTEPAKIVAPANSCDSHHHIFDARIASRTPDAARPDARSGDYRLLQGRIGTSRSIVVTASNYGINNQATIDAIQELGVHCTRGIAVVDSSVTDVELKRLDGYGIRGIRFTRVAPVEVIKTLAHRIADLGWHLQLNIGPRLITDMANALSGLPIPVVFDHLARIHDVNDPALVDLKRLLEKGKTWIKLSGVYITSKVGPPTYADSVAVAKVYVKTAPNRMLWGSDWPHPSAKDPKPDDARVFDLNAEWAPDETTRGMILVDNPNSLYGFAG